MSNNDIGYKPNEKMRDIVNKFNLSKLNYLIK